MENQGLSITPFDELIAHCANGEFAQAFAKAQLNLNSEPQHAEYNRIAGFCLFNLGKYAESLKFYEIAIYFLGENFHCNHEIGAVNMMLGKPDKALDYFYKAYLLDKNHETNMYYLIRALHLIGGAIAKKNIMKFIPVYRKIMAQLPERYIQLSVYCDAIGESALALELINQAMEIFKDDINIIARKARIFFDRGDFLEALIYYDEITQKPNCTAAMFHESAFAAEHIGRLSKAGEDFQHALNLTPKDDILRYNYAQYCINQRNYKLGFELYESRWQTPYFSHRIRNLPAPNWQGEDLTNKTLFIYGEQALGDHIMFGGLLDYLPQNCQIKISVDRRLEALFTRNRYPNIEIISGALNDEANHWHKIQADFVCAIGSLPLRLGFMDKIPHYQNRKMFADSLKIKEFYQFLKPVSHHKIKVGFSFACRSVQYDSHHRSTQLSDWLPMLKDEKFQFINLQYNSSFQEISDFNTQHGTNIICHPTLDCYEDIEGLLGLIANCDIVVSVANTTIHLAGCLHKPTFSLVMLPNSWRWGHSGNTMPWYNSVQILRQIFMGDWSHPMTILHSKISGITKNLGG